MIYRLPTHGRRGYGKRRYRGQYPNRIATFSGAKGIYHVELNDGRRYVFLGTDMTLEARAAPRLCGRELLGILNNPCVYPMTLSDYAAIVFVDRLRRLLGQRSRSGAISAFDSHYPNADWSVYLSDGRIITII